MSMIGRATRLEPEASVVSWALIRRHPLTAFYVLTYLISLGAFLLVLGPDGFFATGSDIAGAGALAIAGPAIACILMTGLFEGKTGLRNLASRLRKWRVGARWYAMALLTGPLVMCATVFGLSLWSDDFRPDIITANNRLSLVMTAIALGLVGPFLEELGWTGFALPQMRKRHGVFATGLLMGLLWSAWHFPLFAGTRDPDGIVPAPLLVGVLLFAWLPAYRVLMVWVYERTQSLLVAYLMHVPISTTAFLLSQEAAPGTAAITSVFIWGAAFWVIVALLAWTNGGHLTKHPKARVSVLLGNNNGRRLMDPQNYARRATYRPPGRWYRRINNTLGVFLTSFGLAPRDAFTLQVRRRRTGRVQRLPILRTTLRGEAYLVSLAGESEWVRNVRAAKGRAILRRRTSHPVLLTEVPVAARPKFLLEYLRQGVKRSGQRGGAKQALYNFGLKPNPSLEDFKEIAARYPVFRIVEGASHSSRSR